MEHTNTNLTNLAFPSILINNLESSFMQVTDTNKTLMTNQSIISAVPNTISNTKQCKLTATTFNEKRNIKIVVAARQYQDRSMRARGYGDISSGVRGLEYLRKIYSTGEFSFVFEHYARSESEFAKLKAITAISGVKTFILNGRKKYNQLEGKKWKQEHQKYEVKQLLQEADFIFHASSGLITPLKNSTGEYSCKTIGVCEYEVNTNCYQKGDPQGIECFDMGLSHSRIYLNERPIHKNQFQNNILHACCINPILNSGVNNKKNNFYFHYSHDEVCLAQSLRLLILIEGNCDRTIILVNSSKYTIETFQQKEFKELILKSCPYQAVKVCGVDSNGKNAELIIYKNPQGQQIKKIRLITPDTLTNSDFLLLQIGAVINNSSGDISTSDVLSIGKIPVFEIFKKKSLFNSLWDKMKSFCMIAGNEQYQNLISVWVRACSNFCREASYRFTKMSLTEINSFQQLRSLRWQAFESKFTTWLKENNQTEAFIRDKSTAILSKKSSDIHLADENI